MKRTPKTIPSSFVKFDTDAHDADSFVSVRNQQIARLNHNALLSGAHARNVLTRFYRGNNASGHSVATPVLTARAGGFPDLRQAEAICHDRIRVSQHIRELSLRIACRVSRAYDVKLYPVISHPRAPRDFENLTAITVNNVAMATYTATLTVPLTEDFLDGGCEFDFAIYAVQDEYGADILGAPLNVGLTFTDASGNIIGFQLNRAAMAGTQIGDIFYCPSNAAVEPRRMTEVTSLSPLAVDWFLTSRATPWLITEQYPINGTDTLQLKEGSFIEVAYLTLNELPRSGNFDDLLETI